MSRITKKNLKQYVISRLIGNPEECKALNTAGCPIRSGVTVESGRSMVEMLGVLAVIGVLSVAGIAGYNTAMRSHKANEVLNAASMLYVMAQAKNQGNGADTNYSEIGTLPSAVSSLAYSASTKAISITFNDEKDCAMAKNKLGDKAEGTCAEGSSSLTVKLGNENTTQGTGEVDIYQACLDAGTCATYSGDPKFGYCTNGKVDYPYCVTEDESRTDLYSCSSGMCYCNNAGNFPNCYTSYQACVDAGECSCDEHNDCSTETYSCSSGYCYCTNGKKNPPDCDSNYPSPVNCHDTYGTDCWSAVVNSSTPPACISAGTCECDTDYCLCTDRTKNFPNC